MSKKPTAKPQKRGAKQARQGRKGLGKAARPPQAQPVAPARVRRLKRPMADVPRMGAITPEEFEASLSQALGGRGWQKTFIRGTGFAQSTVTRYLRGIFPIPQHVALLVEMLQTLRNNGLPVPEAFSVDHRA